MSNMETKNTQPVRVKESVLVEAVRQGHDAFLQVIVDAISEAAGGQLDSDAFSHLNSDQITLWGYLILRDELMDGGFVQLIYNGYGPFFFNNPFAKVMRFWGLKDFSKLLYKAKAIYDARKSELTQPCSDEEFMALFERFPEFDALDDNFVETEEELTAYIAHYVDEHLECFVEVEQILNQS